MLAPSISLGRDFARALDPILLARDCGLEPDPVQARLLTSPARRLLVNCCRQWGKSTTTALIALHEAIYAAPAMIVLVSPSQQQSSELLRKIAGFWQLLPGAPDAEQESLTRMRLSNGSRIISLPGTSSTTRGYSGVTLVVMDEASRVDDELLAAVRPMLATTNGRFIALSTPAGRRGFFFEAWTNGGDSWERISVRADECPRISPAFLSDERSALGPMMFAQEYECQFLDDSTSMFNSELIEAALTDDFPPFFTIA
jgi:hypothetical protein